MDDKIKKITNSFDATLTSLTKSKETLGDWIDELGYQIESTKEQKNLWTELGKVSSLPDPVTASGINLAQSLAENAERISANLINSQIESTIYTASAIVESNAGTVISGASLSYPPGQLPESFYRLDRVESQRINQDNISQKLSLIDQSLADEYNNAWSSLHSIPKDEVRSPMFLIREVVNRLYQHYAPDDKVRSYCNLNQTERITRKNRIDYIASEADPWKKQIFINEEKAFLDIYDELSSAHKPGALDSSKAKGFLYQANGLIKLLLELM